MKRLNRNFLLYLFSYLITAFIPIILIFFINDSSYSQNLQKTMLERRAVDTETAAYSLDAQLSSIYRLPQQIYKSQVVQNYNRDGSTFSRREVILEIRSTLAENELIPEMYLYFRDYKTFASAYNNSYNMTSLQNGDILAFEDVDKLSLQNLLETASRSCILPVTNVNYAFRTTKRVISVVQTLPADNSYAKTCMLVFLDVDYLERLLNLSESEYFIYDDNGQPVLWRNDSMRSPTEIFRLTEEHVRQGSILTENGNTIMTWAKGPYKGWTLVSFQPINQMLDTLRQQRERQVLIFLFFSLFTTGLIVFFMRKTYSPVKKLTKLSLSYSKKNEGSAFQLIENTLTELQADNLRLSVDLQHQMPVLSEHAARKILSTPESLWDDAILEDAIGAGLNLNFSQYQVMILHCLRKETMQAALEQAKDICGHYAVAFFAEPNSYDIVLVLGGSDLLDTQIYQRIDYERLVADAIAVGRQVDTVRRWNESYLSAVLTCGTMTQEMKFLKYEDIPADSYTDYPWKTLQAFTAAVQQKNTKIIRTTGKEIVAYLSADRPSSLEMRQMIFYQTMVLFYEAFPAYQQYIDGCIRKSFMHDPSFHVQELGEIADRIVMEYCEDIEVKDAERETSPVYQSLEIIQREFTRPDFSIKTAAQTVGLSDSRYSTLFHQDMNCTFKEYVDQLRVNLAKKLLHETELLVSRVAEQVGYYNAYSFIRFFKKKTGMTPEDWRVFCGRSSAEKEEGGAE